MMQAIWLDWVVLIFLLLNLAEAVDSARVASPSQWALYSGKELVIRDKPGTLDELAEPEFNSYMEQISGNATNSG